MKLLLLMILFGLVDDFVFQPIILSKLKQKKFWENLCKTKELPFEKYRNDYKAALAIHSLEWTLMVFLPVIIFFPCLNDVILTLLVLCNVVVHYHIDNLKANEIKITLVQDQLFHFIQIVLTWIIIGFSI